MFSYGTMPSHWARAGVVAALVVIVLPLISTSQRIVDAPVPCAMTENGAPDVSVTIIWYGTDACALFAPPLST